MPALPSCLIDPIWDQYVALLPVREDTHPLGCHRPRIPDRVVFDKLVQVLVFGCAYARIADSTCSATTARRRRDEWIAAGVMDTLQTLVLEGYDRLIGLELRDLALDGCLTTAPCGGAWDARRHRRPWCPGAAHSRAAVGGGAHPCLDQCVQETRLVHRAAGGGGGLLARLRHRHHHCPSAHPRGMASLPLGPPTRSQAMSPSLLAQALGHRGRARCRPEHAAKRYQESAWTGRRGYGLIT